MSITSLFNRLALNQVGRFEEIFRSARFPSLKDLYFSFRFPQELERAWRSSSFGTSDVWPFDSFGCFQSESLTPDQRRMRRVPTLFFIVYKHPIHILLKHTRSLLNHSFAAQIPRLRSVNLSHSMQWICNTVNEPDRVLETFRRIRAVHGKSLCITYLREGVSSHIHTSVGNWSSSICLDREP